MYQQCQQTLHAQQQRMFQQFEIQRNICSKYIKFASNQLYSKEAEIISTANDLLQKISLNHKVKDLSEWDVFSTRDSVILEDQSSINLSTFSQKSKTCKIIQRKSGLTSRNNKDIQQQCLAQIQKQCSQKSSLTIKKLVEEYRKLKARTFELQKKEKNMKLKQKLIVDLQEKNVILAKRIQDIQNDLNKAKGECLVLRTENNDLLEQVHKKNSEINSQKKIKIYQEIINHQQNSASKSKSNHNSVSFELLNEVLTEKENIFAFRYEEVKKVEENIQKMIFNEENRCSKCCQIIKKVKTSILTYRQYLQKQGDQFEKFVDKFKEKLLDFSLTEC